MITEGQRIRLRQDYDGIADGILPGDEGTALAYQGEGIWNFEFLHSPFGFYLLHETDVEVV